MMQKTFEIEVDKKQCIVKHDGLTRIEAAESY